MPILFTDQPLPLAQRRSNFYLPLLLGSLGIAAGIWTAKGCASITSGYAATYTYAGIVFFAAALFLCGIPFLIYWRTRWIGIGFVAAGVLSFAAFHGGMAVLSKEGRVAWQHEQRVRFGPDQKASAVVYFRKEVTAQQVEDFASSVLELPAKPGRQGRDFPVFVRGYLRLTPTQANRHWAVALTFADNALPNQVEAYLSAIRADNRVETVFLNASPDSIHFDTKNP
jgi:hypothetical protein